MTDTAKMKILVDTDPGVDDAAALGLVLSRSDIDIVGITSVSGNTNVDQTTINIVKILEVYDRKDIPVFKGSSAILDNQHDSCHYHGKDALGDILHHDPDLSPLKEEHAVLAINRLVHEHKGEITMVCLGPLSNLALAYRLNKNLPSELKDLVIMGGNYKGQGNITMAAEFNFFCDPVAAHIVFEEFTCPLYLVTWELSKVPYFEQEHVIEYCSQNNKKSKFKRKLFEALDILNSSCSLCDPIAMAVAINRSMIKKMHEVFATVELHGEFTKGQVVIDWAPNLRQVGPVKTPNVIIIDEIDVDVYVDMMLQSMK